VRFSHAPDAPLSLLSAHTLFMWDFASYFLDKGKRGEWWI